MSAQGPSLPSEKDLRDMLDNLPPAPAVFTPQSLLVATETIVSLMDSDPAALEFPLQISSSDAISDGLERSILPNSLSGSLLPRHSHLETNGILLQDQPVHLAEMSDSWCRLVTRCVTKF
jgi:hypothetical protein